LASADDDDDAALVPRSLVPGDAAFLLCLARGERCRCALSGDWLPVVYESIAVISIVLLLSLSYTCVHTSGDDELTRSFAMSPLLPRLSESTRFSVILDVSLNKSTTYYPVVNFASLSIEATRHDALYTTLHNILQQQFNKANKQ
jgi:hypothetical protein